MWQNTLLMTAMTAIPIFFVISEFQGSFTPPTNFPVLDASEIGTSPVPELGDTELATFGSGCFWCTEAVFEQLNGVSKVESGYGGGNVKNPSYERVCDGMTGHAEVVQVTFDPKVISYSELLEVFWRSHDPTTRNRQGNDIGPKYRSAIFTHSERQKRLAETYKAKIDAAGVYRSPVVTEIEQFTAFYPASSEHQNFFSSNPRRGYCRGVIAPKLEKLRAIFGDKLEEK